jgi:hypothetical protein
MGAQRIPWRKVRRESLRGERVRGENKGIFAFAARTKPFRLLASGARLCVRMLAPGEVNPNFETWEGPYAV